MANITVCPHCGPRHTVEYDEGYRCRTCTRKCHVVSEEMAAISKDELRRIIHACACRDTKDRLRVFL